MLDAKARFCHNAVSGLRQRATFAIDEGPMCIGIACILQGKAGLTQPATDRMFMSSGTHCLLQGET